MYLSQAQEAWIGRSRECTFFWPIVNNFSEIPFASFLGLDIHKGTALSAS